MYATIRNFSSSNSSKINMPVSNNTESSYNPNVFGPAFWFTLHNASTAYPDVPTDIVKKGMISLIENLALIVPCTTCREHFHNYISMSNLKYVVESKESLFEFFVNAHNYVNYRISKPVVSVEDAKQIYGFNSTNGATVKITYTNTTPSF
jgi:hypothetical protein